MTDLIGWGVVVGYFVAGYYTAKGWFRYTYKIRPTREQWKQMPLGGPFYWSVGERGVTAAGAGFLWPLFYIGLVAYMVGKKMFAGWVVDCDGFFNKTENARKHDWID